MITVDVIVANIWMAFPLFGAGIGEKLDSWLKADTGAIAELKRNMEEYRSQIMRIPDLTDSITVMTVAFGLTAVAHFMADRIVP